MFMFSLEEEKKMLACLRCIGYVCNGGYYCYYFLQGPLSVKLHCVSYSDFFILIQSIMLVFKGYLNILEEHGSCFSQRANKQQAICIRGIKRS